MKAELTEAMYKRSQELELDLHKEEVAELAEVALSQPRKELTDEEIESKANAMFSKVWEDGGDSFDKEKMYQKRMIDAEKMIEDLNTKFSIKTIASLIGTTTPSLWKRRTGRSEWKLREFSNLEELHCKEFSNSINNQINNQ